MEVACRNRLGRIGQSAFCEFTCPDDVIDPAGPRFRRGDPDNNGAIQLTDGIFILNFLFLGGEAPPAPGLDCGEDPAEPDDGLGCETFDSCG